ncbi:MAG TPA: hypothetical protein VFX81_09360 [Burkholderiaceae bacterium]|nr:hypothetical protein [Burkholderiaceae bacterium]
MHRPIEPRQQRFLRGPAPGREPVGDDQCGQTQQRDAAFGAGHDVDLQPHLSVRDEIRREPTFQTPGCGLPQGGVEFRQRAGDVANELSE